MVYMRARIKRSLVSPSSVMLLLLGCQTLAATPCSLSQLAVPSLVKDTAGAVELAAAVNCSGGSFEVEWAGSVIVDETIRLFGGTALNITGAVDGTSVVHAANGTSLFEVDSATLHLYHLTLANGTGEGEGGGAIYAAGATVSTASCIFSSHTGVNGGAIFLDNSEMESSNSLFAANNATDVGGAMYIWASNLTVGGAAMFENNEASSGGALFVSGRSILTLADNNISFARNTASAYGGGIFLYESNSSVTGTVELFHNTADVGGAVFTANSSLSVIGDLLISSNFAHAYGGAFYSATSAIDIAGTVAWENNSALGAGGGLVLWETTMHVQALGEASFTGNTAEYGGAAYTNTSTLVVDGDVLFAENVVCLSGGGLYSDFSIIDISGSARWENNRSPGNGGGLSISMSNITLQNSSTAALVGNTAGVGGAAFIDNGIFMVHGDVSFSANLANDHGGALYASRSVVDMTGFALWEKNTAREWGGALATWSSKVFVQTSGNTKFVNNTAGSFGGAAYVSDSSLLFDGDVHFSSNVAHESGGALSSDVSSITIGGTVVWINNSAVIEGGALAMWRSTLHVQSLGKTEFSWNTGTSGGAICSSIDALLFDGDVLFASNAASDVGGALFSDRSVVNISGTTTWENNTGLVQGGALMALQSNIVVQSSGKTYFFNNAAADTGGAAYVSGSSLLFGGDVIFAENVVDTDGGALYTDDSAVTITGTAVWKGNSAEKGGGGLLMSNSSLLVPYSGTAEFLGNAAESGGAIYFFNCTISFDGDVLFAYNLATDLGGATFIQNSALNVTGSSTWRNNECVNAGGGVAMLDSTLLIEAGSNGSFFDNSANVGGGVFVSTGAAVVVAGRATFVQNIAETGAGIKMGTFSSANFAGGLVTMIGNEASSSGGGMHCESPTQLNLDGVQFESNYGGVSGGAMTTLLAGTVRLAETEAKPATISNCSFSENTAGDAGGALFIGGGFVEISDSSFYYNAAGRSGGAILASGIASFDGCAFVENQAVVGSAITNTVSVSLSFVDFVNNTLLCDDNSLFLEWNDTSSFEMACECCAGDCNTCTVENPNRGQECQPVPEHTTSNAANGAIESLSLQQGFWRSSGTSRDIRECYESSACVGGTEGYCSGGYEGPLCAICADGYTSGLGHTCSKCNDGRRSATITVAAVFLFAVVAIVAQGLRFLGTYAGRTVAGEAAPGGDSAGVQSPFIGARASQALKAVVVSWQVVTQFSMVASVTYPDVYNSFLKYVNVANLNLGWMLAAGCLVDTDFYDNLLVSTIMPLVVVGVVIISHRVATSRYSTYDRQTRARINNRHASALFWVSFLVYASVSSAVFQTFACVDFDNGMSYLRADHSLECYSTKHTLFRVYASVMGVVYPFGIPFCYALVLHKGRGEIKNPITREATITDYSVARDLWVAYRPEAYFYEVVECARRVVLSGVIVFVLPNTAGQIATAFLFALFFAAVFMVLDPYTSGFDIIITDYSVARDLWVAYRPEAYFYEVVECAHRVVLSGVIVFDLPNTAGQIATAFLFALFFAAVFMVLDPYTSGFDTWAARTGHTVVLMSMFVALLQKVNTEEDDDFSQNVFAIVLVVANGVMIVAAGAEACGMCFVTVQEIRQPVPTLSTTTLASSALADTPPALDQDAGDVEQA